MRTKHVILAYCLCMLFWGSAALAQTAAPAELYGSGARTHGVRASGPSPVVQGAGFGPARAQRMTYQLRADVHADVPLFTQRTCVQCHQEQAANNRHVQRGQADCRSCHGAGLIASVEHVSSPLNPLRRHAVVCARCHVGASDSFAQYLVHAPRPLDAETARTFPGLL